MARNTDVGNGGGQKKNAAVGFGSVFVTLVSATTIEAVMRTLGRNLSGKRARSPYLLNDEFSFVPVVLVKIDTCCVIVHIELYVVEVRT